MALRQIVKEGDSVLTKKCRPVVKFDDRLADLIDDMIETLHKAEGVGLAACKPENHRLQRQAGNS